MPVPRPWFRRRKRCLCRDPECQAPATPPTTLQDLAGRSRVTGVRITRAGDELPWPRWLVDAWSSPTCGAVPLKSRVLDPARDRTLHSHLGVRPNTLQAMANNEQFTSNLLAGVQWALQGAGERIVLYTCKSGRHRSVAAVCMTKLILTALLPDAVLSEEHAHRAQWRPSTCAGFCPQCSWEASGRAIPHEAQAGSDAKGR